MQISMLEFSFTNRGVTTKYQVAGKVGCVVTLRRADSDGAVGALDWQRPWLDYSGLNYLDLVKRRNVIQQLLRDQPDFAFLGRITWYWGVTAEQLATLKEAFEPVDGPASSMATLYVRKQSNCVRYVPVN
jgi:hypothetical protein